jgi:F-type H+-transporting ATPase subunit delta
VALSRGGARRYAEAAFEIAERDGSLESWLRALDLAEERLTDPDVSRLLTNPSVPARSREEVIGRILGEDVAGPPRNLLLVLVRRGRFDLLPVIIREFRRLYRRREGIVEATATSARPLDAAELEALTERVAALTGGRVEVRAEVDPGLIGGVTVRVGDRLIDGSVRGRLERLRASLSTTAT